MDKNKILNAASVLFQNIFTYFNELESDEGHKFEKVVPPQGQKVEKGQSEENNDSKA